MSLYVRALLLAFAGGFGHWLLSRLPDSWNAAPLMLLLPVVDAFTVDGTRRKLWCIGLGVVGSVCGMSLGAGIEPLSGMALGLCLGAGLGAARGSLMFTAQSAVGGLLGGAVSQGAAYLLTDTLNAQLQDAVWLGTIGFGIGIVPALFRSTWLTADNMGKRETPLVRKTATLGTDRNADVRVPPSPEVAPVHAILETLPGTNRRRLRHAAGGQGTHAFPATRVNGRGVTGEQWLSDGDVVQIGPRSWTFHDRATRGAMRLGPAVPEAWQRCAVPGDRKAAEETIPAPAPAPRSGIPSTGKVARDIGRVGTRLLCTDGPYAGRVYPLGPDKTTIGRAPTCAVSLPSDTEVSLIHATLTTEPKGGHTLWGDGVQVNGQAVTAPVSLRLGDKVQVGGTTLRYQ